MRIQGNKDPLTDSSFISPACSGLGTCVLHVAWGEMYCYVRLTKRTPPNLYRLRFVFVLASSLFFIANYTAPRVIWWVRWMLMSLAQDLLFWEYEPDVYDYWNFFSQSMFFRPLSLFCFSCSDELPDHHKSQASSFPWAKLLICCTSHADGFLFASESARERSRYFHSKQISHKKEIKYILMRTMVNSS